MLYASKFYEFSNSMGFAIPDIIANKRGMYHIRYIPKPNGKKRMICEPLGALRELQEFIVTNLNGRYIEYPPGACAYIPGRGLKSHLQAHAKADFVVALDIKDFFPSCHPLLITEALRVNLKEEVDRRIPRSPGYHNKFLRDIAELCTFEGGLPQGAPSSPLLSNLVLKSFDTAMQHLGQALMMNRTGPLSSIKSNSYTRYADDILFSGRGDRIHAKEFFVNILEHVEEILNTLGYMQLNYKKSQLVVRNENRLLISNKFIVYNDGTLALTKRYCEHIEGQLFHFAKDRKHLDEHILGKLSWVRHINMAQYVKLIKSYNSLVDKDYGRKL